MPLPNQLYGKLKRILISPDGEELFIILGGRKSKIPVAALKTIEGFFLDKDVIVTFQELIEKEKLGRY